MGKLRAGVVRDLRRPAEEPLAKPLIWSEGPKPVVRRRRDDPRRTMVGAGVTDDSALSAVAPERDRGSLRGCIVEVSPSALTDDAEEVHSGRSESAVAPESGRIPWLRRIGARRLIGEVRAGAVTSQRAMQCTENELRAKRPAQACEVSFRPTVLEGDRARPESSLR